MAVCSSAICELKFAIDVSIYSIQVSTLATTRSQRNKRSDTILIEVPNITSGKREI